MKDLLIEEKGHSCRVRPMVKPPVAQLGLPPSTVHTLSSFALMDLIEPFPGSFLSYQQNGPWNLSLTPGLSELCVSLSLFTRPGCRDVVIFPPTVGAATNSAVNQSDWTSWPQAAEYSRFLRVWEHVVAPSCQSAPTTSLI